MTTQFSPAEKQALCDVCLLSATMKDCLACAFYAPIPFPLATAGIAEHTDTLYGQGQDPDWYTEMEAQKQESREIVTATKPTYDQLIRGAKFTNEHRKETQAWWNEYYSDENVRARMSELRMG